MLKTYRRMSGFRRWLMLMALITAVAGSYSMLRPNPAPITTGPTIPDPGPASGQPQSQPEYDLIVAGGTVYDGSGQPGRRADVAVHQGRVAVVGDLSQARARRRLDATGLAVAPGFINPHSHTWDPIQPTDPAAKASVMQGITTEFGGVDGRSFWPIGQNLDDIAAKGTGVNYGTFVGHGTVRAEVMGYPNRRPSADELQHMASLVATGMAEGAFGLSTGLEYTPGRYGDTSEVIALARAAAAAGGVYSTHLRSEGDNILAALAEALQIGREADLPVNLSHFKVVYPWNWPKFEQVLAKVRTARQQGQTVFADVYPYLAPDYATFLNLGDVYKAYDPATLVFRAARDAALPGKTLAQAAAERSQPPAALAQALLNDDQPTMVAEVISEPQMAALLREDWTIIGTDGEGLPWYDDPARAIRVHPRSYGTYPRVLGRYVREQQQLALATAIRKMTGAVADGLGLPERGYLRPGYWADMVVFDPSSVIDRATWTQPQQYPIGIRDVLINGTVAVAGGQVVSGVRAGQVLRHKR